MTSFNFNDIDLYYYHNTDIDVTRIHSIINHGILSANMIKDKNILYYHRNYINSSCKKDYISVSHFPRTIFQYYHIQNELYQNNHGQITFIISGDIEALDKQFYRRKYHYTNERHVKDCISPDKLEGIIVRYCDLYKPLKELPVKLDYSNFDDMIKKCFDTISFLKEVYEYQKNTDELYILIGKLVEKKVTSDLEVNIIREKIELYLANYVADAFKRILNKENPTLKDYLSIYQDKLPIYVMNKYDILPLNEVDNLIKNAETRFKMTYPNRDYENMSLKEAEMKKKEYYEIINLELEMCHSDLSIYLEGFSGPLTIEGEKIKEKILNIKK